MEAVKVVYDVSFVTEIVVKRAYVLEIHSFVIKDLANVKAGLF